MLSPELVAPRSLTPAYPLLHLLESSEILPIVDSVMTIGLVPSPDPARYLEKCCKLQYLKQRGRSTCALCYRNSPIKTKDVAPHHDVMISLSGNTLISLPLTPPHKTLHSHPHSHPHSPPPHPRSFSPTTTSIVQLHIRSLSWPVTSTPPYNFTFIRTSTFKSRELNQEKSLSFSSCCWPKTPSTLWSLLP